MRKKGMNELSNELHRHYGQLLGVESPWRVRAVKLEMAEKKVEIEIEWTSGEALHCPECGKQCGMKDYAVERRWRHLDVMRFETVLRCRVPRSDCPEHGVKTLRVPWAEPGSRFTLLFEKFAIDVLLACRSLVQAKALLGLHWDSLQRIMQRAVERGLSRRGCEHLRYLGLDEKSFLAGQSYVSVLTDLEGSRVLEVKEGRDKQAGALLLATLSEEQRVQVEAVALDMAGFYVAAVEEVLPQAAIVHDKFHIAKHLGEAVDKVRREEHKTLQSEGDETLKGSRQLWLFNPLNWNAQQRASFARLKELNLKVGRAFAIKELFAKLWNYHYQTSARKFFKSWFGWASRSRLKPIIKVARMLKAHLENILTYLRHPITNAVTEGLNSKIQAIKANARGFRSFENYRIRILFFCGKLSLHPQ
jgi:transposase